MIEHLYKAVTSQNEATFGFWVPEGSDPMQVAQEVASDGNYLEQIEGIDRNVEILRVLKVTEEHAEDTYSYITRIIR